MKLEDIGFYTLTNKRALTSSVSTNLMRCELILTDRCNFKCNYCMPLRPEIRGTLTLAESTAVVDKWIDGGLENIRFSGGEPTLYRGLRELVGRCKSAGMRNIAISTNGSHDLEYYQSLHKAGVNDFSISLDSGCCSVSDEMAGCKSGTWEKVVKNIREISKFCYVTVGMVFTEKNIDKAIEHIEFAHSLGVADIRIISAAQYNRGIANLASLDASILDSHPILKYRVGNYLAGRNVRGMTDTDSKRCKMALDDMIIAGNYHFPCVIYMRQQGAPLGTIAGKSIVDIRKEREAWYNRTDTHQEEICKRTCLDVCVDFNNVADGK